MAVARAGGRHRSAGGAELLGLTVGGKVVERRASCEERVAAECGGCASARRRSASWRAMASEQS